jgi:hypothetical protein
MSYRTTETPHLTKFLICSILVNLKHWNRLKGQQHNYCHNHTEPELTTAHSHVLVHIMSQDSLHTSAYCFALYHPSKVIPPLDQSQMLLLHSLPRTWKASIQMAFSTEILHMQMPPCFTNLNI